MHVKWTEKIKNAVVLERVGEGKIMLELIKKKERNCLLKNALEGMVNGKKVRGRRYQMIDNIMINELYAATKRKAENKVRVENAEFAMKDLPLGRTL